MYRLCLRTNALSLTPKQSRSSAAVSPQPGLRSAWKSRPAQTRSYSTSGDAERREILKKFGPPISISGAAGEAATALFVRGNMDKAQDRVESSVKKLLEQLRADKELRLIFRSANDAGSELANQENLSKLAGFLQKNLSLDEATTEFFDYMYRNKILTDIETVLESYQKMVWRARKEVHATLTCTSEAEARRFAQTKEFAQLTADYVPRDHKLQLDFSADPAMGDGFRLDLGERQIELTLSSLLRKFETQREQASEEHVKRLTAYIDSLPLFVPQEQAEQEAKQYLSHPLAGALRLKEAYLPNQH